ncbi:MAG TPA: 4-alpha-glucanotransferase, partial [Bryobacteraceae bacterium]|nr:4-alpha-glucanotransferase [Bryobacteraceae bacterium]
MENTVLGRAAAEYGIEPEYTDIWGRVHSTPDPVARAILKSLGAGETDPEISHAIEHRHWNRWSRPLDITVVVRENADSIPLRVPTDRAGASVKLEIAWEGGGVEHHWFWLPELPTLETVSAGDGEFLAKRFPLPPLRLGYHRIRVYWMKDPELEIFGESKFIVCPKRARGVDGRMAGVAVSLYGLRSARNWGCGDFTDLHAAVDAVASAGAAFVALNPLHAIPNRQPYNTSPYLPECSLYRNFIYLDVDRIGKTSVDAGEIEALRASEFVEYERVAELKLRVLRELFQDFLNAGGSREFDRHIESEGAALQDFAVYCALYEEMHRRDPNLWLWTDWPEAYRDPRSPQVAAFAREQE